jgi:RHS repeat-associated protein
LYGLERISEKQSSGTSFYGYDGHGSVRQLTNSAGAVTDTYDYDAFGNLINQTGSTPNNYLFAGEQYDPALSLYYNRARYLNTTTGRFWSMDSTEGGDKDPLSLHKYLYAEANPVSNVDPNGYDILSIILGQRVHDLIGADFLTWAEENGHIGEYDATIKQILGYSEPGLSSFRPDLTDLTTNEVYEIKSIDSEALGYAQLGGYLIILNLSDKQHRGWIPGESYQPPFDISLGDGLHDAWVDPPFEGVIVYQIVGIEHVFALVAVAAKATQSALAEIGLDFGVAGMEAEEGAP